MNIAMFTNNYKPFIGGVPISIERLSEGLRSLGHRVTVFAPEPEGKLSAEQEKDVVRFKVFYRKADRGMILGNCFDKKIEVFFREGNFDVIHVHHPVLVRAEGGLRPDGAAGAGHPGHPSRPHPARLPLPRGGRCFAGEV